GFARKDNAVSALPNWYLTDVADEQIALSYANGRDRHAAQIDIPRTADQVEVRANFAREIVIQYPHCNPGSKFERLDLAGVGKQGHDLNLARAFSLRVKACLFLDAKDAADYNSSTSAHLHARAAQCSQQYRTI